MTKVAHVGESKGRWNIVSVVKLKMMKKTKEYEVKSGIMTAKG